MWFSMQKMVPEKKLEYKKLVSLALMVVLVAYVHHILKITKDVLVLSHLGAEFISAIKLWVIVPLTLIFMVGYIKLTDFVSRSRLIHLMNWGFIGFFMLFVFFIYPNRHQLTLTCTSELWLIKGEHLRFLREVMNNWHLSLFYFFSEMWVTVMLSISAWQVINHLSSQEDAKRFYPLFGCISSVGGILASRIATFSAQYFVWPTGLHFLSVTLLLGALFISLNLNYLVNLVGIEYFNSAKLQVKKNKISFKEGIKTILASKPIALITCLMIGFNCSINLIDGLWKKSFEIVFNHDPNLIQAFTGKVQFYISITSCILAFVGIRLLKRFSWRVVASITPCVLLVFGAFFFTCVSCNRTIYLMGFSVSVMQLAVYIGAFNDVFAHSTKRTLFDATKEMAYLPLDEDLRTKGKAAAELIGMRIGKGCGAAVQQALLMLPILGTNLVELAPSIGLICLLIIFWWLSSVRKLAGFVES